MSLAPYLIKDAIIICLIGFSISISLASLFARRNNYKIDATQELYSIGLSNVFASFWSCWPSAGSLSRSSLLESTGAKSQFASLFSSSIIIVMILWLAPLFKTLPKLCLASIIVVSLKGLLFQVTDLFTLLRVNRIESVIFFFLRNTMRI
jgi:MFS superfamily sulfate permease-like transporter